MENLNAVNDAQQAVVEPVGGNELSKGDAAEPVSGARPTEHKQTAAENSGFRKIRLENEAYKKEIAKLRERLSDLSELERYKRESELYLSKLVENRMEADLKAIQSLDPSVTELEGIGGDFLRLIENGIDARVAYSAVKAASESGLAQRPPEPGAVGVTENSQSEFFTSKELDRLTKRELENPVIFRKAMKSLKRL